MELSFALKTREAEEQKQAARMCRLEREHAVSMQTLRDEREAQVVALREEAERMRGENDRQVVELREELERQQGLFRRQIEQSRVEYEAHLVKIKADNERLEVELREECEGRVQEHVGECCRGGAGTCVEIRPLLAHASRCLLV